MPKQENVRRWLKRTVVGIAGVLVLSTIVLSYEEHVSLHDAFLTILVLFAAGEPGHLQFDEVRLETRYLMVFTIYAGVLGITMLMGGAVDLILRLRMPMLYEGKGKKMKDHIILCGLGRVGYKTLVELEKFGQDVIIIEKNEDSPLAAQALKRKIPIIFDDVRNDDALVRAGIEHARAVIAATNDDLINLEVALDSREHRPEIRVVVRLFDQRLADKIAKGFNIQVAFSSSALAAPAFAAAAVDKSIRSSFYVEDRLYVCSTFLVPENSPAAGRDVASIRDEFDVNTIMIMTGDQKQWAPPGDSLLPGGASIFIVGPFQKVRDFERSVGVSEELTSS